MTLESIPSPTTNRLLTLGDISRLDDIPAHQLAYAIKRFNITETQRAGTLRLYDAAAVVQIRQALQKIRKLHRSTPQV